MAIVHQRDGKTGTVYVYESKSTYYPELKQSRSKRRLIGKIDPVSGEMVACGKRGRPKKARPPDVSMEAEDNGTQELRKKLVEVSTENQRYQEQVRELRAENTNLRIELDRLRKRIEQIHRLTDVSSQNGT